MTLEQVHADQLRQGGAKVAAELRRLAAEVERETAKADRIGQPGVATYGRVAEAIQHAVLWGIPNLHLPELASYAADADVARARDE